MNHLVTRARAQFDVDGLHDKTDDVTLVATNSEGKKVSFSGRNVRKSNIASKSGFTLQAPQIGGPPGGGPHFFLNSNGANVLCSTNRNTFA